MGCSPEDLPEAMNDRERWRERVRDIRADDEMMMIRLHSFPFDIISIFRHVFLKILMVLHIFIFVKVTWRTFQEEIEREREKEKEREKEGEIF